MKRYKIICPLINFQIPLVLIGHAEWSHEKVKRFFRERAKELTEGITLCDGIKIRRFSKEDFDDLKTAPSFFVPRHLRISPNLFVLEKYVTDKDKDYHEIHNIMLNAVLALRLLKGGGVRGRSLFHILLSDKRQLTSRSWEPEPDFELPIGSMYALNFEEIPELKRLLQKILHTDFGRQRNLRLACKRFQRVYDESDAEDKLIDIVIAFEALFRGGGKGNLPIGQKIAIAGSTLIAKNDEERAEIRHFLAKAYSLRSSMVHGDEIEEPIVMNGEHLWLEEFVNRLEDYLRKSIRKTFE